MLLNFEEVLLAEFGKEATLGEQLAVPLQLSGFRSDGSLASQPEATDQRYCCWDRLSNGYGYTEAWVEKLVRALSDPETYEEIVGIAPTRR